MPLQSKGPCVGNPGHNSIECMGKNLPMPVNANLLSDAFLFQTYWVASTDFIGARMCQSISASAWQVPTYVRWCPPQQSMSVSANLYNLCDYVSLYQPVLIGTRLRQSVPIHTTFARLCQMVCLALSVPTWTLPTYACSCHSDPHSVPLCQFISTCPSQCQPVPDGTSLFQLMPICDNLLFSAKCQPVSPFPDGYRQYHPFQVVPVSTNLCLVVKIHSSVLASACIVKLATLYQIVPNYKVVFTCVRQCNG